MVGKGKGKGRINSPKMDKLGKIDAGLKVWVGGLPEGVTWKKLEAHFADVVQAKLTEIMGKGRACCAFESEEDAQTCIDSFNGSDLDGTTIEVDVWTQKEKRPEGEAPRKRPREEREERGGGKGKSAKGAAAEKGGAKGKGKSKSLGTPGMKEKFKAIDDSLKVWIGGLSSKTKLKELKQHFTDHGCEPKMADLLKPGTACLAFETTDDAESAVGACNGSELDEKTLEVDVWVKQEKK